MAPPSVRPPPRSASGDGGLQLVDAPSGTSSGSSARGIAGARGAADPSLSVEAQFEADFAVHLMQKGTPRAGASLLAERQPGGLKAMQPPPKRGSAHRAQSVGATQPALSQQRPTLRRLRYLVKWGHWQLQVHEVDSPQLSATVLDEIVRPFSPWVQQIYLLHAHRGRSARERFAQVHEVWQHLAPLHHLLQRRAAFDAVMKEAEAIGLASLLSVVDAKHVERYRIIFPTILETITFFENFSLEVQPRAKNRELQRMKDVAQRRLRQAAETIREVLERPDLVEALAGRAEVVARSGLLSSSPALEALEVPPEGVEDETADDDAASGSENGSEGSDDFFSCDEDEGAGQAAKPSKAKARHDVDIRPLQGRVAALPRGKGPHSWRPFEEYNFEVRSQSYFRDKRKEPAGKSMFEVLSLDIFRIGPSGPIWRAASHPDLYAQSARRQGDKRFLLVQNWIVPPLQVNIVAGLDPKAPWLSRGGDTPQGRAWRRFLSLSPAEQKKAFKLIMSVEQGPWLVKRAVPKRPLLVGRQLGMQTYHVPNDHFEMVVDVSSGRTEQLATGIVMRGLRNIQLAMACLIEAVHEDELPEALLLCANLTNVNTSNIFCPDESTA